MTFDVENHLGAVERTASSLERHGKPARSVTLARIYDAAVDDLWDALTNPERLARWFLPVEGDLRLGGRYQLKGKAGGAITACEAPKRLDLTWEFGGDTSWVEVRLTPEGSDRTRLTLSHIAHVSEHWGQYGPGAAGIGWELGLLGLALHLADPAAQFDEAALSSSSEGKALIVGSSEAWAEADIKSGAEPSEARSAARRTSAFYTGSAQPDD
jgi:uncharacterized protein YndB with AHSA1/START domain